MLRETRDMVKYVDGVGSVVRGALQAAVLLRRGGGSRIPRQFRRTAELDAAKQRPKGEGQDGPSQA